LGPTVEDRLEIMELYARSLWALDLGDADRFVATFTPDGTLQMRHRYQGREDIRRFVELFRQRDFGFPRAQHLLTNLIIEAEEEAERCHSQAYVTRIHRLPGQHRGNCQIIWTGYCTDICVRWERSWRFQSRTLRAWEGDVTAIISSAGRGHDREAAGHDR